MRTRPLGDLADLTVGHVGPMASEYVESGVPFLRSLNIRPFRINALDIKFISREFHERLKKSALRPGDVVVVRTGEPGTAAVIPESLPEANCSDVVIVRPRPGLDPQYLAYLVNGASRGFVNSRTVGAVQQHFNVGAARELPVPDLALEEQRRIAGALGALDDLIDTNLALMQQCATQIRYLYRRMMATAETELSPFFEVFDVDFGAPFKGSQFNKSREGRPLLRIRDLTTFTSDVWTLEQRSDETIISAGDVVVGMDAEFRPTFWLGAPSLLNQRVCRVRARPAGQAFTREALVGPLAYIEGYKTGTTVSHLNKGDLAEIKIDVPTQSALTRFEAVAEPLHASIVGLKQECGILAEARDELLPLLLSGRVRVEDLTA